jgi:transcriptional regulator with GAF, ATPase, and Fis domain
MAETHTASLVGADRPTTRPRAATLRVVYPRDLPWEHRFSGEPVTLGRQPDDGSPPLHHATVSRRHAQVWWDVQGHHAVRDAGSRHGTLLGTSVIGQMPRILVDGDLLRLGDVFVVYEVPADEDADAVDRDILPGASPAMARLRARVARAAADPSPALVTGDTGTGKEWVARELHRLSRRKGPLVAVNCATLTRELVESQLFGHVRGAFTGATGDADGLFRQADGGTLFLDEIGELPLSLQPKLLRVVQDGVVQPVGSSRTITVDVRLVAATNRELGVSVDAGEFRRDLLARLSKWELRLPSLAARRGDLLDWVERMWRAWHRERDESRAMPQLTPGAVAAILTAPWLDNLRGIDRLVHDLAAKRLASVDTSDLPEWLRASDPARSVTASTPAVSTPVSPPSPSPSSPSSPPPPAGARPPVPSREEFVEVWERLGHSVRAVAKHFGRDRRQIYRWLEAHGLRAPAGEDSDD